MTESRSVRRRIIRSCVEGRGCSGGRMFLLFGGVTGGEWAELSEVEDGESVLPLYFSAIEQIGE